MPLSTWPPSQRVGRAWVLWLGKWPCKGARAAAQLSLHPGGSWVLPTPPQTPLPEHLVLSPQGPPAAGLYSGSQPPTPHWDTARDHGSVLPCREATCQLVALPTGRPQGAWAQLYLPCQLSWAARSLSIPQNHQEKLDGHQRSRFRSTSPLAAPRASPTFPAPF